MACTEGPRLCDFAKQRQFQPNFARNYPFCPLPFKLSVGKKYFSPTFDLRAAQLVTPNESYASNLIVVPAYTADDQWVRLEDFKKNFGSPPLPTSRSPAAPPGQQVDNSYSEDPGEYVETPYQEDPGEYVENPEPVVAQRTRGIAKAGSVSNMTPRGSVEDNGAAGLVPPMVQTGHTSPNPANGAPLTPTSPTGQAYPIGSPQNPGGPNPGQRGMGPGPGQRGMGPGGPRGGGPGPGQRGQPGPGVQPNPGMGPGQRGMGPGGPRGGPGPRGGHGMGLGGPQRLRTGSQPPELGAALPNQEQPVQTPTQPIPPVQVAVPPAQPIPGENLTPRQDAGPNPGQRGMGPRGGMGPGTGMGRGGGPGPGGPGVGPGGRGGMGPGQPGPRGGPGGGPGMGPGMGPAPGMGVRGGGPGPGMGGNPSGNPGMGPGPGMGVRGGGPGMGVRGGPGPGRGGPGPRGGPPPGQRGTAPVPAPEPVYSEVSYVEGAGTGEYVEDPNNPY